MKIKKAKGKGKWLIVLAYLVVLVAVTVAAKGNQPKIVGYTYDTGNTVWEMAKRHCPDNMDIRDFMREIEKANDIKDSTVYANYGYKIPVYEAESEYLDLNTVVGYETTEDGLKLFTNDGSWYFINK